MPEAKTAAMMTLRVRLFASLRERVRQDELTWELPDGATVGDLWRALCATYTDLVAMADAVSFAVNREYVTRTHRLVDGDEVALIPPVSGG